MNNFKEAFQKGQNPLGTWVMTGSPVVSELLACAGFDFLVVDAEHGNSGLFGLLHQFQAITCRPGVTPIVRLPGHDPVFIKQILDVVGAETLMCPMIGSVEEARALVRASLYPPHGIRGCAKMVRPAAFGRDAAYQSTAKDRLCLIAQLETEDAMGKAIEIGKVEGIDSVFVGPGDLAISMGLPKGMGDEKLKKIIGETVKTCRAAGVHIGTVMPTVELAKWFLAQGGSYVAIGGDLGMLMGVSRQMLEAMNEQ